MWRVIQTSRDLNVSSRIHTRTQRLPQPAGQSRLARRRAMLRLPLLLVVLTHPSRTASVTNTPSFAAKLERYHEKLERLTVAPHDTTTESKLDLWQQKLDKLNSLSPDNAFLSDEDEELLVAMQSWGRLTPDQMDGVAKQLQRIRDEREEDRSDYDLDRSEYSDDVSIVFDNMSEK